MLKTAAIIFGVFFIVAGLAGFSSALAPGGMLFGLFMVGTVHNIVHLRHAVVPMHYLARAPLLDITAVSQDISDHGRPSVPLRFG